MTNTQKRCRVGSTLLVCVPVYIIIGPFECFNIILEKITGTQVEKEEDERGFAIFEDSKAFLYLEEYSAGLAAHESLHILDFVYEFINEPFSPDERASYSLQELVEACESINSIKPMTISQATKRLATLK